jgi:hypothetical protein
MNLYVVKTFDLDGPEHVSACLHRCRPIIRITESRRSTMNSNANDAELPAYLRQPNGVELSIITY